MQTNQNKPFLYLKIADALRQQIENDHYQPGEYLPSEHEICRQFGVSRISVRKGLQILVDEGLITRRAGQGSKVIMHSKTVHHPKHKTLTIFATSPSFYMDLGMPFVIDSFEQKYPDIKVNMVRVPNYPFWEFTESMRNNKLKPDLVFMTDKHYDQVSNPDHYRDLNKVLANYKSLIYPKLLKKFSKNLTVKAVPVTFSPVILVYNPEFFKQSAVEEPQPDWTLADLTSALKQLTRDTNNDGIRDLYGMSISHANTRWPVLALQNMNRLGDLFEHPEQLKSTLDLIHRLLYADQSAVLYTPWEQENHGEPFIQSKAAMTLTTVLEMAAWKVQSLRFKPKIAPLSFGPNKSTLLSANVLMIPESSNNPEAAEAFTQFIIHTGVQEQLARMTGFLSVHKTINDQVWDQVTLDLMNIGNFQLEGGVFLNDEITSAELMRKLDADTNLFWTGLQSTDETIKRIAQK